MLIPDSTFLRFQILAEKDYLAIKLLQEAYSDNGQLGFGGTFRKGIY